MWFCAVTSSDELCWSMPFTQSPAATERLDTMVDHCRSRELIGIGGFEWALFTSLCNLTHAVRNALLFVLVLTAAVSWDTARSVDP